MELLNSEVMVVEEPTTDNRRNGTIELAELELVLTGGGIGDVVAV
jgi:hypothetical protein